MQEFDKHLGNVRASDLAEYFCVSDATIWRWAKEGTIPKPFKIGSRTLWDWQSIIEHTEALKAPK